MKPLRSLLNWPVDTCIFFFSLSLICAGLLLNSSLKQRKRCFVLKPVIVETKNAFQLCQGMKCRWSKWMYVSCLLNRFSRWRLTAYTKCTECVSCTAKRFSSHAEHPERPIVFLSSLKTLPCLIKTPLHQERKLPLHSAQHLQAGGISG